MSDVDYSEACRFWTEFFEQEQLVSKLDQLVSVESSAHHLANFGDTKLTVCRATSIGDGFLSDTYALTAHVQSGACYTAFVKALPSNPFMRSPAIAQRVFNREEAIYRHLHAALRTLRDEAGFTNADIPLNVPRMYYGSVKEGSAESADGAKTDYEAIIVLENLKLQGFAMVDKRTGCNAVQAKATLNTFANFHALGIAFLRQQKADGEYALPDWMQFIKDKLLFLEMAPMVMQPLVPVYAEVVRAMGDPEAASWLEEQAQNLSEIMKPEDVAQCEPLLCVLHGDCWNNNMMYRTDEEGNVQMRLIDWQITRLGHPVFDCLHFLFGGTSPELRAEHFDELMDNYFSTLCDSLNKLGIHLELEGYTGDEFRQDVRKRLRWALFLSLLMIPGMMDQEMVESVSEFTDDDVARLNADGRKPEDDMMEMKDKMTSFITAENILAKKPIAQRITQVVSEIRAALNQ